MIKKLNKDFYTRDVLELAPDLLGKKIIRRINSQLSEFYITEVEAYRGFEDLACHASKGRTPRTEVMFMEGGKIYMYLIYGMHWMFNIVAGEEGNPQAVLIRSLRGIKGPGRVSRALALDRSFYGESLVTSSQIWLQEGIKVKHYQTGQRISVDYAGDYWKGKDWRFFIGDDEL